MVIFGVLVVGTLELILGTILCIAGLSLLVVGLIHYWDASLDQSVTTGIYQYSRNPQVIGIYLLFLSMILTIGSGINLLFWSISTVCAHFSILGEEYSLEQQYGESYLDFKRKILHYFFI